MCQNESCLLFRYRIHCTKALVCSIFRYATTARASEDLIQGVKECDVEWRLTSDVLTINNKYSDAGDISFGGKEIFHFLSEINTVSTQEHRGSGDFTLINFSV